MSSKYVCDGCGRETSATRYPSGTPGWHKPASWFQRQDADGIQDACSRDCIDKIAAKSGKTSVVIPI